MYTHMYVYVYIRQPPLWGHQAVRDGAPVSSVWISGLGFITGPPYPPVQTKNHTITPCRTSLPNFWPPSRPSKNIEKPIVFQHFPQLGSKMTSMLAYLAPS